MASRVHERNGRNDSATSKKKHQKKHDGRNDSAMSRTRSAVREAAAVETEGRSVACRRQDGRTDRPTQIDTDTHRWCLAGRDGWEAAASGPADAGAALSTYGHSHRQISARHRCRSQPAAPAAVGLPS
jgi:hypothetical protein